MPARRAVTAWFYVFRENEIYAEPTFPNYEYECNLSTVGIDCKIKLYPVYYNIALDS